MGILLLLLLIEAALKRPNPDVTDYYNAADPNLKQYITDPFTGLKEDTFTYKSYGAGL